MTILCQTKMECAQDRKRSRRFPRGPDAFGLDLGGRFCSSSDAKKSASKPLKSNR